MSVTFGLFTQVSGSGPLGPFVSLLNAKRGIFTRGFATREKTAFSVHSVK